jgi:hypothetical protein
MTGDTVSHDAWYDGIFDQALELLPLSPSHCLTPPPSPLPNVNKYTVYKYTVYGGCGLRVCGFEPQTDKQLPQIPLTGNFF